MPFKRKFAKSARIGNLLASAPIPSFHLGKNFFDCKERYLAERTKCPLEGKFAKGTQNLNFVAAAPILPGPKSIAAKR